MKRKILAVVLSAVMALSLGACGDSQVKGPTITELADYKNISAIIDEVTEENAQAYFEQLINQAGIGYVEVKDRDVVQAGDIVATDYTGYVDGVAFVGGSTIDKGVSNPQYIDVSNNSGVNIKTGTTIANYIDKFTDGLIGAKINEDKSGKVTFPNGYGSTTLVDDDEDDSNNKKVTLDNKEVTFVFNVKAIYTKTTPENITDAMVAEKFSESYNVSTVADFMKFVKEDAEKNVRKNYFYSIVDSAGVSVVRVEDRDTVQEKDIVKVDYTGYYDGVAFKSGTATDQYIDLTHNCSINLTTGEVGKVFEDGFSDALKGAKVGDEVSADITLSSKYGETTLVDGDKDTTNDVKVDLSGKTVTFKYTVKEIYLEVTPDTITDEIVKEYFEEAYGVSTAADFIKALESELEYNYVLTHVIENSTFDISESYMNKRVDQYQEIYEDLYCGDTEIEKFLDTNYKISLENARLQWAASLKSRVEAELVFAAIVEEAKLDLDEEKLETYVKSVQESANGKNGNSYFKDKENIYKMLGYGDAESGKAYSLNQEAVRIYMMGLCANAQSE